MPDVDKLSKRPLEYLWGTGVPPLFGGSYLFLLGTSDLLKHILPQTYLAQEGIKWLPACLVIALMWGQRSIRDRVVSPRGGYVEPETPKWFLLSVVLVALVMGLAGGRAPDLYFLDNDGLIWPGVAVLLGAMSLYYGRKQKMPLLLAYGIYLMCLALLIWWLPLSDAERFGLLESGAGGPLAVFGAMRLRAFLKANPKPVDLTTGG